MADIKEKGIHIEAICKRYGKGDTAVDALKGVMIYAERSAATGGGGGAKTTKAVEKTAVLQ